MVSGFFTSPCDHCLMSSAVARADAEVVEEVDI